MRISRLAVLSCVLLVGALLYWRSTPQLPERPSLLLQVQKLSQLATVRYTVQRIVTLTEAKSPVGSESIVLIVQARVEAGVDLGSLHAQDVQVAKDGSVKVRLPRAKILNASIDENDTKVWDRQKTWWTPWVSYSLDLEKRCRLQGLEAAKRSAVEMGILTASQSNAETAVRSLLQLAGVKNVSFLPVSPID